MPLHHEQSSGINASGSQSDLDPQLTMSDFRSGYEFIESSDNSSHNHNQPQESHQELEESNSSNHQYEDGHNVLNQQSAPATTQHPPMFQQLQVPQDHQHNNLPALMNA